MHHPRLWQAIAGGLLLLIFWLDTAFAPRGLVIPVLYVIPTILFVGGSTFAEPLIIAAMATVLTAAGVYSMPGGAAQPPDAMNRGIAVLVIWTSAGLVVGYVHLVERWTLRMTAGERRACAVDAAIAGHRVRAGSVGDRRSHRPEGDDHLRQRQVLRDLPVLPRGAPRAGSPHHQFRLSPGGVHPRRCGAPSRTARCGAASCATAPRTDRSTGSIPPSSRSSTRRASRGNTWPFAATSPRARPPKSNCAMRRR